MPAQFDSTALYYTILSSKNTDVGTGAKTHAILHSRKNTGQKSQLTYVSSAHAPYTCEFEP